MLLHLPCSAFRRTLPWSAPLAGYLYHTQNSRHRPLGAGAPAVGCTPILAATAPPRPFGYLCAVPNRHNPHRFTFDAVEEPIRRHNHLSIGQVGELGKETARGGKSLKPPKNALRSAPEPNRGSRIIAEDVDNSTKELPPPRGGEADLHGQSSASNSSASARTASSAWPFAFAISRSPRARSRNSWRSCSARS